MHVPQTGGNRVPSALDYLRSLHGGQRAAVAPGSGSEWPPLRHFADEEDYRAHYERTYCHATTLFRVAGLWVHFEPQRFTHAFYDSTRQNDIKNFFSWDRAIRIDWIGYLLAHPDAQLHQGHLPRQHHPDPTRCVAVLGNYAVVVTVRRWDATRLKGHFVTAFPPASTLDSIMAAPPWTRETCWEELERRKHRPYPGE